MAKSYRVAIGNEDGQSILLPARFTSRKKAQEYADAWEKASSESDSGCWAKVRTFEGKKRIDWRTDEHIQRVQKPSC